MGLIETIRVRDGRLPWLSRHLARLRESVEALGLTPPPADSADRTRIAAGSGEGVVRLELRNGRVEVSTRAVAPRQPVALVVSEQPYHPYPHKTTQRDQFERALAAAQHRGAGDAVLVNADGHVTEGTAWSLFWWDNGTLCTPAEGLGILPGIGRGRIMELIGVREERVRSPALAGRSLFLVNAVRGVVEINSFERQPVPSDPRTAELSASFWPD